MLSEKFNHLISESPVNSAIAAISAIVPSGAGSLCICLNNTPLVLQPASEQKAVADEAVYEFCRKEIRMMLTCLGHQFDHIAGNDLFLLKDGTQKGHGFIP